MAKKRNLFAEKRSVKITDSTPIVSARGRQDMYWTRNQFNETYKRWRPGLKVPQYVNLKNQHTIVDSFNLKGFEYGQWVPQDERFNFLAGQTIALIDLNNILLFKHNLGLNKTLGIAFGARGKGGSAAAHFEPSTWMINLTRPHGVGTFAHEYGHALDYFFGYYIEPIRDYASLTNASSIAMNFTLPKDKNSLRYKAQNVIKHIIWQKPGTKSSYYTRLQKATKSEYWFRHTELFARAFEQYIKYKLNQRGIMNRFLYFEKYSEKYYMKPAELKRVVPYFDKLISGMRNVVNKK